MGSGLGQQLAWGFLLGSPSAWPQPLALQINRDSRVRLYHVTSSETLEESTEYKGRLSVEEGRVLSISRVTMQDAKTFVCRVEAGSHGTGENRTELRVYSE